MSAQIEIIFSAVYLLASFVVLVKSTSFFYKTRDERRGRGVLVTEYSAPEGIRPAMIELIMTGKISNKIWPVTIVDLAYRKFIKIEEENNSGRFSLSLTKDYENDSSLYFYEKKVLGIIFSTEKIMQSKDLESDRNFNKNIDTALISLKSFVVADVYENTNLYKRVEEHTNPSYLTIALGALWVVFWFVSNSEYEFKSDSAISLWLCTVFLIILATFFLGRTQTFFHKKGYLLKEQLAGFRHYLEMAEKNRLEDMPANLFQENLAYAMAFGLEKKWSSILNHENAKLYNKLSKTFD